VSMSVVVPSSGGSFWPLAARIASVANMSDCNLTKGASPRSTHSLWALIIRDHVLVIGKLFMAGRANARLFPDLWVEQGSHLGP
jgi:hypothetical protein